MSKIATAAESWCKAQSMFREAEAIDPAGAPGAVVHTSYYAMHHAARAVLMAVNDVAPIRHDKVIQEFGRLAFIRNDAELKLAGRAINEMMDKRNIWDYEAGGATAAQAREALETAVSFLNVVAEKFRF